MWPIAGDIACALTDACEDEPAVSAMTTAAATSIAKATARLDLWNFFMG
jgi:hypothetical protein